MQKLLPLLVVFWGLCCLPPVLSAPCEAAPLQVCVDDESPPFSSRNARGELEGFDIDVWLALDLKQPFVFKSVDFPTGLAHLEENLCDVMLFNVTITSERQKRFQFSDPYLHSSLNAMVRKDAPDISSVQDLRGKTIAVLKGSTGDLYVAANIKNSVILALPSEKKVFDAFREKKAQAVVLDKPELQAYINRHGGAIILEPALANETYAYAFNKKNTALRDAVSDALRRLHSAGITRELYSKWFGAPLPDAP